jgi:hypothetical protein
MLIRISAAAIVYKEERIIHMIANRSITVVFNQITWPVFHLWFVETTCHKSIDATAISAINVNITTTIEPYYQCALIGPL